jgi:hypothetical protein
VARVVQKKIPGGSRGLKVGSNFVSELFSGEFSGHFFGGRIAH